MVDIVNLVSILVCVAFFTLIERNVLGYIHLRRGPNNPSVGGLFVPFADAVKLFFKETRARPASNRVLFYWICVFTLLIPSLLWLPYCVGGTHSNHAVLFVVAVSSVGVYGTLGAGWSSNSKYSMLGGVRAVAQTISYEVAITLLILGFVMFFRYDIITANPVPAGSWVSIFGILFAVSVLAETNRSPFDFAEGESELVSGFNTEFSGVLFVMIFLAEYMSIIFISFLVASLWCCVVFSDLLLFTFCVSFYFIWARGTLPRFRYDQLIYLAWNSFLPIALVGLVVLMGL